MRTYTFVCIGENQVAVTVDVQALADEAYRAHALQLLRDHASVATIEIWCDEAVVDSLARDGVRPWPRAIPPTRTLPVSTRAHRRPDGRALGSTPSGPRSPSAWAVVTTGAWLAAA